MATTAEADTYGAQMQDYFDAGLKRALAIPNRGPVRYGADGKLKREIMDAYEEYGFYVFTGLIDPRELAELQADFRNMLDHLPAEPGGSLDRKGRPALGAGFKSRLVHWGKPLSDPAGGTDKARGRHPVKMFEPKAAADVPDQVVFTIASQLQLSDACLRLYAHPDVLRIAGSVNGDDFTPFQEGIIIKNPGEGRSFSWHQDGVTHWDNPNWDQHIHGVNFMPQLFRSTPANGVWFVPGSQRDGHIDIKAKVEAAGGECLPDAVPLVCEAGDMAISNRQILHGSFANTSPDLRVTLGMGFHPRRAVIGATGISTETGEDVTYDAEWVAKRSEIIGYAIDARRQHYPNEEPYSYQPHANAGTAFRWDAAGREAIRDYNLKDLRI